ncbi:O-antigen ligase family protein [Comamonas sp.]|uniref:O-antigen ligase family protein n=1 Tax=Comamonas sp. TaxID=34028 RepID=UPI003A8E1D41
MFKVHCVGRQLSLGDLSCLLCALLGLVILVSLPVWSWLPAESWHDAQRTGQILIITLAISIGVVSGAFRWQPYFVVRPVRRAIAVIAMLGLCSAALAHQPHWALVEWVTFWGSLGLGWMVVVTHHRFKSEDADRVLLASGFLVCGLLSIKFMTTYLATILDATAPMDAWLLFSGFDNVRFFGQFSTLTLPLLAMPLLSGAWLGRFRYLVISVFVLWWVQAIASGTRGTWLGMAVAAVGLAFSGRAGRRWASMQMAGAASGLVACWILMDWLPSLMGLDVVRGPGDRLNASLSGREAIWRQAIEMIVHKPLLGFGPMHFADIANPIAAHPHQAWLQWASEWGVPSAILVSGVVSYALWAAFRRLTAWSQAIEEGPNLYHCLVAAVLASLTQGMVDGVLVMPYTETWLTIISGWLLAIHWQERMPRPDEAACAQSYFVIGVTFILSAATLCAILVRDYPTSWAQRRSQVYQNNQHFQPRFWVQGVIAKEVMPP